MQTEITRDRRPHRLHGWRLKTWSLWTKPHNAYVILLTAAVMVQARVWRLRAN